MHNFKKTFCCVLSFVMSIGSLCGCQGNAKETVNEAGEYAQGKTCIVAYNSSGYGHSWLEKAAEEAFEALEIKRYRVKEK